MTENRIVSVSRDIAAPASVIFELIADPEQQIRWDGNDNLESSESGQRVHGVGAVFATKLTNGLTRENHVVDFVEGTTISWRPAEPGGEPIGHQWSWELDPIDANHTRVTHTYDWSDLTDETRFPRARSTTPEYLTASLVRLAELAEAAE